jgi:hypothetical protein
MRSVAVVAFGMLAVSLPAHAETPVAAQQVRTEGRMIPTGGSLDFREPGEKAAMRSKRLRPPARQTASDTPQLDWLYDFVGRLIEGEPQATPRRMARAPRLTPVAHVVPTAPTAPLPTSATTKPLPAQITTGTLIFPRAPGQLDGVHKDDLDAIVVSEAEKSQARNDLVKLELARRSYDETRLSGASAFDRRTDWRVLERARDALSDAEISASKAAGFEANAYINDNSRIILVAIAGTQDLRRDFIEADIWRALIKAQSPQHFYFAKSYIRTIQQRYQAQGYVTECAGHSLGGGACAYAAAELGIRAVVVNPISAGKLGDLARHYVTNYVVDGDIANAIYSLRGNELSGDVQLIKHRRDAVRQQLNDKYGPLAGPIRVIRDIQNSVKVHQIDRALDLIAAYAETERPK